MLYVGTVAATFKTRLEPTKRTCTGQHGHFPVDKRNRWAGEVSASPRGDAASIPSYFLKLGECALMRVRARYPFGSLGAQYA